MRPATVTTTTAFGQMLLDQLAENNLHQAGFCRLVGSPAGWVQQIRQGSKTPPLERMPQWADVLQLQGSDRQRFFDYAAICHLPPAVRKRFVQLVNASIGTK